MTKLSLRGQGATLLVTALSAAFGTILLLITGAIGTYVASSPYGGRDQVELALTVLALVFFGIAVYVGAVVTANTVGTVIAGRTREIALLRLIGASGGALRRGVVREGLVVGALGALSGVLIGIALTFATITIAVATDQMPALDYAYVSPQILAPLTIVALSTTIAAWVGSRKVLEVSPMEATGNAQEERLEAVRRHPVRYSVAGLFVLGGGGLLVVGVMLGQTDISGLLVAMLGGIVSFTGVILGAPLVMPPLLTLVGRMLGSLFGAALGGRAVTSLAAGNAVRNPQRSTRAILGLVIGVTLVTMFGVASESYRSILLDAQAAQPELYAEVDQVVNVTIAIFSVLFGFSALLASIGMVNNLSLSVLQRRRELGLLRAIGFTAQQVRRMIVAESLQMTVAAVLFGLALGGVYGWCGAQALLGSIPATGGIVAPSIPWTLVLVVVGGAAVLTLLASLAPSRRATRISPVEALAV